MRRPAALLALLLLLQWGAGIGHCLAALSGSAVAIEICTPDGPQMVSLALDEADAKDKSAPATAAHACCLRVILPETVPPAAGTIRIAYPALASAMRAGLAPFPPRAPPHQPRAPPTA